MRRTLVLPLVLFAAACGGSDYISGPSGGGTALPPPGHLTYVVDPTGTDTVPSGILLKWDFDTLPGLAYWAVYSRPAVGASWGLRAQTTSPTFHDQGAPSAQYYVTAVDQSGNESAPSNVVTIDEALALAAPESLYTTALNGGVALTWTDNAYLSDPGAFLHYRVYSASYNLDQNSCGTWYVEGTTVSPEFAVGVLTNGQPRCFAVTAVDTLGYESLWSPIQQDTPRPDAHDVVVYAAQAQVAGSAFRFWTDLNADGLAEDNELGLAYDSTSAAADFKVDRDMSGNLWLTPVRSGTQVLDYGAVTDVSDVHYAPASGYVTTAVQAKPGEAYIFSMNGGDGFARYGAVRVSHVGQTFLILDWAYQTDPGNPMLVAAR